MGDLAKLLKSAVIANLFDTVTGENLLVLTRSPLKIINTYFNKISPFFEAIVISVLKSTCTGHVRGNYRKF